MSHVISVCAWSSAYLAVGITAAEYASCFVLFYVLSKSENATILITVCS